MQLKHRFSTLSLLLLVGSGFAIAAVTHVLIDSNGPSISSTPGNNVHKAPDPPEETKDRRAKQPERHTPSNERSYKTGSAEKTNRSMDETARSQDTSVAESSELERLTDVADSNGGSEARAVSTTRDADEQTTSGSVENERDHIIERNLSVANDLMGEPEE